LASPKTQATNVKAITKPLTNIEVREAKPGMTDSFNTYRR